LKVRDFFARFDAGYNEGHVVSSRLPSITKLQAGRRFAKVAAPGGGRALLLPEIPIACDRREHVMLSHQCDRL